MCYPKNIRLKNQILKSWDLARLTASVAEYTPYKSQNPHTARPFYKPDPVLSTLIGNPAICIIHTIKHCKIIQNHNSHLLRHPFQTLWVGWTWRGKIGPTACGSFVLWSSPPTTPRRSWIPTPKALAYSFATWNSSAFRPGQASEGIRPIRHLKD